MVFSSIYFTFLFFPILLLLYYPCRGKVRNLILLSGSLVFYAYGEPVFVYVLLGSVGINYLLARGIESAREKQKTGKVFLLLAILLNVGLLFVYKYLFFFAGLLGSMLSVSLPAKELVLPIGISFFTFQALSYVIDVYRGTKAQKNPLDLALYICFFPQLIAGPIVRYKDIEEDLTAERRKKGGIFSICEKTAEGEEMPMFAAGVERFLIGFSKKVLLANNLALVADSVFDAKDFSTVSVAAAWLGAVCYTLQIYYDFSGYSDMAIGLGRMFGFRFAENFDHPYTAKSITDFWRKWHISLSGWFRDYVYIPLGGSRTTGGKRIRNLFVVWLLTGLWHGANLTFVAWGMLYFVFLILEKYAIRPESKGRLFSCIYRIFTLAVVNFLWVIFRAADLPAAWAFLARMLGKASSGGRGLDLAWIMGRLREQGIFLLFALIFCCPLRKWLLEKKMPEAGGRVRAALYPALLIFLFLWSVSYLVLGAHNPFLYFNF